MSRENGKANENFIYDRPFRGYSCRGGRLLVSPSSALRCLYYNNGELKFNLTKLKLYNRLLLHLLVQIFQLQN